MDLSVVIVSFNTAHVLPEALSSLKEAIKNLKAEVFVVDNASFDNTIAMVRKDFPWVKLVANDRNLGFSRANNLAIKKAKGKYLLILNPDTKTLPDTPTTMISFMDANRDVGVSTCRVQFPDGQLDPDCRRHFPTPWRSFCHFSGLGKIFPKSKIFNQYYMGYLSADKEHEVDACAGAFMLVRSSAIKKVGLFDEDFFFYGEDLDWCFRFKEAGYKIVFNPAAEIIHYKGVSSGIKKATQKLSKATYESKKRALKESTRAMVLFYKKHYKDKYPFFITWFVIAAIWTLTQIRISRI